MNVKRFISVLLGLAVVSISVSSMGQEAELPYYAEQKIRPNVMLFIDSSGSMDWTGEEVPPYRDRYEIVQDVLTGSAPQPVTHDDKTVWEPHLGPGERWAGADLGVKVFTVREVGLDETDNMEYTCEPDGNYFVFFDPFDADREQDQVMNSLSTINDYVLSQEAAQGIDLPCITRVDTGDNNNVNNDYYQGSSDHREVWMATDDCSIGMTFGEAVRTYWEYEDTGTAAGTVSNPDWVVPVYHTDWAIANGWTDPTTGKHWDYCSYDLVCCYHWEGDHCLRPTNDLATYERPTWGNYFIIYDADLASHGAEDIENYKMTWEDFRNAVGEFDDYCTSNWVDDVFGDQPYASWEYWPYDYLGLDNPPDTDGSLLERAVYYTQNCDSSNDGYHVVAGGEAPSDSEIRSDIIDRLPYAQAVDELLPDGTEGQDGNTGPEFIKDEFSGTRLDEYIRLKLGLPVAPDMSEIDIDEPDFGGYFQDLYYNDVWLEDPGIMDLYTDVNYGLMIFDNSNWSCDNDDFPPDSWNNCVGADLIFNACSWADFDAYPSISSPEQNDVIQDYIANMDGGDFDGATPIASSLHDLWRYFYDTEMASNCGRANGGYCDPYPDGETMHDSIREFDLGYPFASGSYNDHIIQDDPYYTDECRYNNIIYLSDGGQTQGEGGNYSYDLDSVISYQEYWVDKLVNQNSKRTQLVKPYFIGFGTEVSDDDMKDQLEAMAAASKIDADDDFDYFLPAEDDDELHAALTKIMNAILAADFAVSSPEISTRDEVTITSYFDISTESPLWRGHLTAWTEPGNTLYSYIQAGCSACLEGQTPCTVADSCTAFESPNDLQWPNLTGDAPRGDLANSLNAKSSVDRSIFTYIPDGTGGLQRVEFTTSNLDLLDDYIDPDDYYGDTVEERIINLVRGVDGATLADGTSLNWKLGGIYHSKPNIAKPMNNSKQMGRVAGSTTYSQFVTDKENRDKFVYTGTMYGLLHAFSLYLNTDDGYIGGEEVFAFIPTGVLKYLRMLYEGTQIYGVDGFPAITDAIFKGDPDDESDDEWKTTLIAGLGGGGTIVYALDITDTDASTEGDNVVNLWNFRHPKLGYTWSTPITAPIIVEDSGTVIKKPATLFAGGKSDNPNVGGEFFILDTETGGIIKTFNLPDTDQVDPNSIGYGNAGVTYSGTVNYNQGPSSPALYDSNNNGGYDWIYVGDYQGRIWKMNLTSEDPSNWTHCLFYDAADATGDGNSITPDWRKPIWNTPSVVRGPNNSVLVYFATGHMKGNQAADSIPNHLYAIEDTDDKNTNQCSYGSLLANTFGGTTVGYPYKFELKEKPITHIYVFDQNLMLKTYSPDKTQPCSKGTVRLYKMHYLTAEGLFEDGDRIKGDEPGENYSVSGLSMDANGVLWESSPGEAPQAVSDPIDNFAAPMSWAEGVTF